MRKEFNKFWDWLEKYIDLIAPVLMALLFGILVLIAILECLK